MNKLSQYITAMAICGLSISAIAEPQSEKTREQKPPRPEFSKIDSNADKQISFEEFSNFKPPVGDAQKIFNKIDSNQDGYISKEEFKAHKPEHKHKKRKE